MDQHASTAAAVSTPAAAGANERAMFVTPLPTPSRPALAPAPLPPSTAIIPPSAPRPTRPLTARLSIPLSIPVATDLVRKPTPKHGIDSLGNLCRQPLGLQEKHVTGAVQALISRSSASSSCSHALDILAGHLRETDRELGDIMDGLTRMDQILWEAAKIQPNQPNQLHQPQQQQQQKPNQSQSQSKVTTPVIDAIPTSPTAPRSSGWARLRPSYRSLLAQQTRNRQPQTFVRGLVAKHQRDMEAAEVAATARAAATATIAAAITAAGTTNVTASSSSSSSSTDTTPSFVPPRPLSLLTPAHASLNHSDAIDSSLAPSAATPSSSFSSPTVVSQQRAPQMFSPVTPAHLVATHSAEPADPTA